MFIVIIISIFNQNDVEMMIPFCRRSRNGRSPKTTDNKPGGDSTNDEYVLNACYLRVLNVHVY